MRTAMNHNTTWTSEADHTTRAVQGMAIAAVIFGSFAIFAVSTVPYCGLVCFLQWKCYGFMFMITSILQGLSLLILNSSICLDNPVMRAMETDNHYLFSQMMDIFGDKCEIGVGFKCGIASTILWFITGVFTCCKPPPGRYKDDCLTHNMQMSSEAATARRMTQALGATTTSTPSPSNKIDEAISATYYESKHQNISAKPSEESNGPSNINI